MCNHDQWREGALAILCCAILQPFFAAAQGNVTTYHNDNARTGQYLTETNLTLANVNTNTFGLLFSQPVDGQIYGQPLYVAGVNIANKGIHNVVVVATENDSVYAFDADNNLGSNAAPLWQTNFLNAAAGVTAVPNGDVGSGNIAPVIGITSTPVIDPVTQTVYVEAKTKEVTSSTTSYVHRLHALDLGSGAEKFGGPVVISPVVKGTGDGNDGSGNVPFNGLRQLNRPGLLLLNGVVYIAYASHGDNGPYHGWILGFNAQTLKPQGIYITTPNGGLGGFWEAGDGPCADTNGAIYAVTGNGSFDGSTNSDYGDSFVKLTVSGTNLTQADYFTPYNQASLSGSDLDVGSGGALLLPDAAGSATHQHLMTGGGKSGILYLVDRDNLGHFNSANNNQIVQSLTGLPGLFSTPAYFNGMIYVIGGGGSLEAFTCTNGAFGTTPAATGPEGYGWPGATPSISANGASNAIVWAVQPAGSAILRAYNATNVAMEIYNSTQAGSRDGLGAPVKFTLPTVANGKVYVPTAAAVAVFGNGLWGTPPTITPNGGVFTNSITVSLSSSVAGAMIYYTLDGTVPTTSSTPYTIPFTLTNATVVQAIASAPNENISNPSAALFYPVTSNTVIAGFGAGWTLNNGAALSSNVLTLTDGNGGEARTAFYNTPVYIGSFNAQFVYQGVGEADGTAFVIQDSSSGTGALGYSGGALGYGGITPSAAVEFNLYSGAGGSGTAYATDGATGTYNSTLPLNLDDGNPVWISLNYDGSYLTERLDDLVTGDVYETNYQVILASTLGSNIALVGFTGGTGGSVSVQTISDFIFTELSPPAASPTFAPNGAIFTNSILVSINAQGSGGQIYYTLDGSFPSTNSIAYTGPFLLTNTAAIKAVAITPNAAPSAPAFAFFGEQSVGTGISAFGGNGAGWTLNGGATVTGDVLELTDGNGSEARSAFFNTRQIVTNFVARFIYQSTGGADGTTFTLQNAATGASSLGGGGGNLGYNGITPSAAVEFNLYSGQGGTGTRFATDGTTGGYTSTLPLDLGANDPIWVSLIYDGATMAERLVDQNNGNTFTASYAVNLASVIGTNMPWVGFTGGDGGVSSIQTVTDFTFSPQFAAPALSASLSGSQLTLSWTAAPVTYIVEFTTNLANPTVWQQVSQAPVTTGNRVTVRLAAGSTNAYYRLKAQ